MAGPSTIFADQLLNHIFNGAALSLPSNWFLALYTSAPSDAGGGVEVSGAGYTRLSLLRNSSVFPTSTARNLGLAATGSFPEATANWGTVVAMAFFDASTGGVMKWWGMLTAPQVINTGDTFKVPAGTAGIQATL